MVTIEDTNTLPVEEYNKFYKDIRLGISYGRGIFANRSFKKGEVIEIAPYILDKGVAFNDYIFSSHMPKYKSLIVFGYGSMYNHSDTPNVNYVLMHHNSDKPEDSYFIYYAKRNINKDEECKISYGKDWWTTRNIKQKGGSNRKKYCLVK